MPSASEEQEPVNKERKPTVRKAWQWVKGVPTFWKGVGAVATTVATILGILPWVFPSLQPQPPSSETWAEITALREGPHLSLGEYIQRPGVGAEARRDAETLSEEDRERVGSILFFDVEATGYEGESIHAVWSLYEVDTGKAISGLTNQKAWPYSLLAPRSQSRKLSLETWVPFSREHEDPVLASLELFGGEEEGRLDYEEVTISAQNEGKAAKASTNP